MRRVNHKTITGTLSLFRILPLNGFNPVRAKQKLLRRRKRVYESSSSRRKCQKLISTDNNSLEFGKSCEDLSWNHRSSTPHRSETNGIAERAARRVKEGTSAVLLQSGMDQKWWPDSMECYCYLRNVTSWQTAKLFMKDVSENQSKGQLFFLEQWLKIIRVQREICQDFISLARKCYLVSFLGMN